jgi:hypothetical protein
MDGDLEAIVSIPEELEDEFSSSNVGEELALVQNDESCEDILLFNVDVALSVIAGDDETIEEERLQKLCVKYPAKKVSWLEISDKMADD